jgi:hypothetical protein
MSTLVPYLGMLLYFLRLGGKEHSNLLRPCATLVLVINSRERPTSLLSLITPHLSHDVLQRGLHHVLFYWFRAVCHSFLLAS